jgi:hypothetical protein
MNHLPPEPGSRCRPFGFYSKIRQDIRSRRFTTVVNDTGG